MPVIGDIKRGRKIGLDNGQEYVWSACISCGKERWVVIKDGVPRSKRCSACGTPQTEETKKKLRGENNYHWKGGRVKARHYVAIKLMPDDYFIEMANPSRYVLEHRLVVAKALGRCLQPWEIVHHKEGFAKDDNRYPETLQLVQEMQHNQLTILTNKVKKLTEENKKLKIKLNRLRQEYPK